MKRRVFFLIVFFLPVFALGAVIKFQSPSLDDNDFRMIFPLDINKDGLLIKELRINEQKWQDFFIFREGQYVEIGKSLTKGKYEVHVDYAWMNGREYTVALSAHPENNPQISLFQEAKGKAPLKGGIPLGEEGFCRVFWAEEWVGLARKGELSCITFSGRKTDLEGRQFILMDGDNSIEYQILDLKESAPTEKAAGTHPVTLTCKIAFPLDIPALGKKRLLLLLGKPEFSDEIAFTITGENVGKTVNNETISLEFHPVSGQVNIIEDVKENIRLYNEAGVIHWNPGCNIPGIAWDHSFNWNPPPGFEEKIGKFLYIHTRSGPFQKIKDVNLEVKYALQKDQSYFVSETRMVVNKNLGVIALRNDEMVLYKELFDTLIYRDKQGNIVTMPLEEKPGYPDGFVHAAPDDLDWVGLLNLVENYGFFSLRIDYVNGNLGPTGNWLNKPGTYFYAPSNGSYVYWVRPLLYTWSEYTTRNLLTFVPQGSFFYEKNAYILLRLNKGYEKELDVLLLKLRNPVRIF